MAFRQHNPNVITPPNPSVSNKKDVGVIGEKEPTVRSEFVDKENIPPSFSPPMPPSVHGFHDVEMERLVRGVNRFGLNHGSDNPSRVEGSILGLAPAYPPAVVRLTSLKKANSAAESSEPLAQHRFNRSLWNRAGSNTTQQDSIKKLDVLGRGIRSPKRIPFGNVHHGGCDSARNDVKSAEIPPPRADFASIVRCNAPQSPNTLQDQHHQHLLLKEAAPKDPSLPAAVADAIKASRECRGTTKVATVEKAELYLRHAIAEYHAGRITEAPNGSCYNNIVHGYADLKEPAKAEAILHLMWSDFQQGNELAEPNVRIYTSVLYAWEKSKKESAPERCEAILQQMHRLHDSGIAKLCKPDLYAYTVCLHTWADSKRPDAPKRAEQLFRKMKDRYHTGDTELQPDSVCYVNLLNAYANSAIEYAHTEDLLWEMVDDFIAGNESAKPIIRNFNTVLAVWSKSGSAEAPERSEAIIRRLHELNKWGALDTKSDQYTYSLLLKTWTTCNRHNSAQEAEQALYWMESLHSEGDQGARLDVIKYTTVISALARSGNPGSAETLLEKMLEDYQKGNSKAKPDAKSFNMVLSGWSRYHNATVAAARAQALLHRMWNYRAVHIAPDTWSYNTVLFCWKNANGPKQGESLLLDMDRMAAKGFAKARPNSTSFQAVIDSWKKSNFPFKHQHIHQLQEESQKRFGESAKSKNMDSRSFK